MENNKFSTRNGQVVKNLREQKLRAGQPFMINIKDLSTNECYLEYPNGSINLVTVIHSTRDLDIVKKLSSKEANNLRKKLDFTLVK